MIRFATTDDMVWLLEMLYQFHEESPYKHIPLNEGYVKGYLSGILEADKNQTILLIAETEDGIRAGFLAATKTVFHLTGTPIAAELAWWVEAPFRGTPAANKLKEAFEYWASVVGCKSIQMCTMTNQYHDILGRYYKRNGYTHAETSFLKEI